MNKEDVLSVIKKYNMLENCDRIVVGLSGGADSVCLLSVLNSLKAEYGFSLVAAHINHGIRGAEAQRDEESCKRLCESLNVPLEILHADIPTLSKQQGIGEEECGRIVRYDFFRSLAGERGKIATAHNLNDNAETLLLNLVRGAGSKGACGIPPVRDNIIRPLIETDRESIEKYCEENELQYVTDSTNLECEYSRNKIRIKVLPTLCEINQNAVGALSGFASRMREQEAFLESVVNEKYALCVKDSELYEAEFSALDIFLKKRIAGRFLSELSHGEVESKHIDAFLRFVGSGKALVTASATEIVSRDGKIFKKPEQAEQFSVDFSLDDKKVNLPFGEISVEKYDTKDLQNLNKDMLDNLIDCDKISNTLILRSRKDGDKFTFSKRRVTKTVKKLFNEDKIPPEVRNRMIILDSDGEVAWLRGYGTNKKFRIGADTKKAIKLNISQE
jgi:tRNA(Ile)-lysidine synthase